MQVQSGIAPIGRVEWGTHFCHFYKSAADLAETLVPFFKAGLESNERCLWVTAAPLGKEQARAALNGHVSGLDRRIASGQIAIYDHAEWYARHGGGDPKAIAQLWVDTTEEALRRGYRGLRITGNTAFLDSGSWDGFIDYESYLREAFEGQRLLALCSYDAERCDADAVLDVVHAHDFALARRRGAWEVVEHASVKRSREALESLNTELEQRIEARTRELSGALAHQRMMTAELSHRVKNTIASVQALVDRSLQGGGSFEDARATIRGRLFALARVHDLLAAADWHGVGLRELLEAVLAPYNGRIRRAVDEVRLNPRAALGLAMMAHELATNAAKYGALSGREGGVAVLAEAAAGEPSTLELSWRETGGPRVERPGREGFGTRLIRRIATHDLRGECELAFDRAGLACTVRVPVREILATATACPHGSLH
ncbi:MEDS domain-containing protein [Thalassobaculum sp.]|uniref:MEDS domain-containing protein n=1 Tax=Thalassobaculum sp. TaxID=2022740 RepID=UPI0032EAAC0F